MQGARALPAAVLADACRRRPADGNAAVTGAFAALAEYYSAKQTKQTDCGLNLGWNHPGAKETSKSVNNLKTCEPPRRNAHCFQTCTQNSAW